MSTELKNLLADCLRFVEASEWDRRHAAENQYCPCCELPEDAWKDQKEHHPGCLWVDLVARLRKATIDGPKVPA